VAPPVGEREREGEGGGVAGWASAQEERKGARGRVGPSRPRDGERGRKGFCHFLFQINFSNTFFN